MMVQYSDDRPDPSMAKQVLGWCAAVSQDGGLDRAIPVFREQFDAERRRVRAMA